MATYTDKQILFIRELKNKNLTWERIAEEYNKEYKDDDKKTANALRKIYFKYEFVDFNDDTIISNLEAKRKIAKENLKLRKTQEILLSKKITNEYILEQLKYTIKNGNLNKIDIPKFKPSKNKKEMAIEILYSDIHAGKKTQTFNLEILENRIKEFSKHMLNEIVRNDVQYNVSTIIFAILGDLIENSYFHSMESMSACEIENSEQIRIITELTFKYFIYPLALTGKKIMIAAVPGNHSRSLMKPTYNEPGKKALSWVIYNFLKMISEEMGFKNVEFIIPTGLYCTVSIFDRIILYEHGSECKSTRESDLETFIHKRAKQIKKMIDFFRMGDKHSYTVYNKGRIIINGSLCGTDYYADSKGYSGFACQTMNFYVNRKKGCIFYKSFPIDLESEE